MKYTKKALALFLALCMMVTSAPLTSYATEDVQPAATAVEEAVSDSEEVLTNEEMIGNSPAVLANTEAPIDAAVFCSDVHDSTSDASSVFSGVKTSGLTFSTASFVGDTFTDTSSSYSTVTSVVQSALGDANVECFYSYGSHDSKSDIEDVTGLLYSENYYIYTISQTDMASASNAAVEAENFTTTVSGLDKTKPLFIISHMPLHARRNDNNGAANWYEAISVAAEAMDITFFWAHNHTSESSVDTAAYYVAKDGSETMEIEGGSTVTPNFTYMNAGYINANGQNPARKGIATTVAIYEDYIVFQDYNSSGAYTGTYAHNVTVEREFEGSVEITEQTFTESDSTATVTVTTIANAMTVTNVSGDVTAFADIFSDYVAYQIAMEGYTEGTAAKVTMTVPEDMDTSNLLVYYTDGTTTEQITDYTLNADGSVTFTTTKMGIFAYGTPAEVIDSSAVLTGIEITSEPTTSNYLVNDALDLDGMVVTATYDNGQTKTVAWNQNGDIADGYALSGFDMSMSGTHTVNVTYGGFTDTFDIKVFEKIFNEENSNVTIEVSVPGVTAVNVVDKSGDEAVQTAGLEVFEEGFQAYDITLEGYNQGETVEVTFDIPEGMDADKYRVYYLPEEGTPEKMPGKNNDDGTYTFTTNHFSTYAGGVSLLNDEHPDPTTATVTGATTTETKTVYVLVSTPTASNQYIIASTGSAGSGYALKESTTTGSSVTINAEGNGISAPYIETTDETIMWDATSGIKLQSVNGEYYLRQQQSSGSRSLSFSTSQSTNWTAGTNSLSYEGNRNTYYVRCSNGTWSLTSSGAQNVYFYEKQTVTVTTSANGTYSIAGNPETVEKVVVEGTTVDLGSTLTFVPESGDTTTTDTSATAAYTVHADAKGIVSGINGNTLTFTGSYGTAIVKVSYTVTVNGKDNIVDNYITIVAKEPAYSIEITKDDAVVTDVIPVKGVTSTTTLQLGKTVTYETADGITTVTPGDGTVEWEIPEDQQSIATVDQNGLVTFKGVNGAVNVTVSYKVSEGKFVTDTITISANTSSYATPEDGTVDFPEYPNEGAVRFDKTAEAVGNFSQTGIAKVELSMTGVPYTTENAMDVVVMLDMTGSMSVDGMEAAEEATKAFVKTIVQNEDGSYNSNRVAVYAFNSGSSSPYELVSLKSINSDAELTTANTAIDTASDQQASGGTPYDEATQKVYEVLQAAKTDGIGNDRQQFCVFMSDGGPTTYFADDGDGTYTEVTNSGSGTSALTNYMSGYSSSDSSSWSFTLPSEYYTNLMKADGVTVYTVGLLLQNAPNNPSPWSSMTDSTYDATTDTLTTIGSHYYFTSNILKQMATDESKYIDIFNVDDADNATAKFTAIAAQILEAATDVVVEDKIADEYTMIFDVPETVDSENLPAGQEFYIEVLEYTLDSEHERTEIKNSKVKLYLAKDSDGNYYAASDSEGTAYAAPVYEAVAEGEKGYYDLVDGEYVFTAEGNGAYNMISGAVVEGNASDNLVIDTPFFHYEASTRILVWTEEKLTTTELALSYFVYLDGSAGFVGKEGEIDAGTYPTNDYATLTYENYLGNKCQQKFPVPQLTWNGAQVSYVFYLVNEQGQPINKAGQVVDFANAAFITDIFTESVVWNEEEGVTELSATKKAQELLPSVYTLYDPTTEYEIHVYQTEKGTDIYNYFVITNGQETTKVYNTKAGTKYSTPGTYTSLMESMGNFDFANTTVAFAVVWAPTLVEDIAVVDYGLPVVINVVQNDILQNTVSGIGLSNAAYGTTAMNTGVSTTSKLGTAALTTADGSTISIENENAVRFTQKDMTFTEPTSFYYESPVEFYEDSVKQEGYMYSKVTVVPATSIYYEDTEVFVKFTDSTTSESGYGEWSVEGDANTSATQDADRPGESQLSNALDADNIYGYDSVYLNSNTYSLGSAHKVTVSSAEASSWPTATFTFTGTAFDVISLTSNATGTITVNVANDEGTYANWFVDTYYGYTFTQDTDYPYIKYTFSYGTDGKWHMIATKEVVEAVAEADESTEVPAEPEVGDKFVTFEKNGTWTTTTDTDNSLYQIPVIKSPKMPYDTYTVTITPRYANAFNHMGDDSYDFYLDAIRVYNPAQESDAANEVYVEDGEGYPEYIEIRTRLLGQDGFDTTEDSVTGAVFIDGFGTSGGISDYSEYGPNNEVYLQKGQAVAFKLSNSAYATVDAVHLGVKAPTGGDASVTVTELNGNSQTITTSSATEQYFDISDCTTWTDSETKVLVISNPSDAMVSLTNLKITYTDPAEATILMMSSEDAAEAVSFMSLRYLASVPVEEVFVPETMEVNVNKTSVRANEYVTVTVTTSADVEKVTVNGEEVSTSRVDQSTGLTTWTYYVKAVEKGELALEVIAYNSDGLASESVVNTVEVTASAEEQLKEFLSELLGWLFG